MSANHENEADNSQLHLEDDDHTQIYKDHNLENAAMQVALDSHQVEQTDSRTVNINTNAAEVQNPSNLALQMPLLAIDSAAPATTKATSEALVSQEKLYENPNDECSNLDAAYGAREDSKGTIRLEDAD